MTLDYEFDEFPGIQYSSEFIPNQRSFQSILSIVLANEQNKTERDSVGTSISCRKIIKKHKHSIRLQMDRVGEEREKESERVQELLFQLNVCLPLCSLYEMIAVPIFPS